MKTSIKASILGVALITCIYAVQSAEDVKKLDTQQIEQIIGLKGKYSQEENVFKVSKPRSDVKIEVDQFKMPAFMGLSSWAAFTQASNGQVMMMGDTVAFEDEVNEAMSAAFDAGLEVTALHNHFFFDKPKVYFMHIGGMGDAAELSQGVKKVYDKITQIRLANPVPGSLFPQTISAENKITPISLEKILGIKGEAKDGMFKVTIGRQAMMHGTKVGKEMGVNTWAAFAGTDYQAVVDGDFAMLEHEIQPVLRSMRKDGINIVAIHQHMAQESPHYFFMHYWGKGRAQDLAKAVKNALDAQTSAKQMEGKGENWLNKILQKTVGVTTPNFVPSYCLSAETRLKRNSELS